MRKNEQTRTTMMQLMRIWRLKKSKEHAVKLAYLKTTKICTKDSDIQKEERRKNVSNLICLFTSTDRTPS